MDVRLRDRFIGLWAKYFGPAELPICMYYSDDVGCRKFLRPTKGHVCMVGQLDLARRGETVSFDKDSIGCFGGKRYLGFTTQTMPDFEYFLSCGIPGKIEGERYKKTPELVRELMKDAVPFSAPARYAVFKRWDKLTEKDAPDVVIFFASPDVLSGLYTLAGFDTAAPDGVICPFGAGCSTITQRPYLEGQRPEPRAVLGMFDVSARPFVPEAALSFSVPLKKFIAMVNDMEESFLTTASWAKVRKRIHST